MSFKRFGREIMLAAGLLAGSADVAAAKPAESAKVVNIGLKDSGINESRRSQKVEDFKNEVVQILSALFPGDEEKARQAIASELDAVLAPLKSRPEVERLAAIDKFAKDWFRLNNAAINKKQGHHKGEADLRAEHANAIERAEDVKRKLTEFFDSKTPDDQAMRILQSIVSEGSSVKYNNLEFKRDDGSGDIFLNGQKVDSTSRKEFIERYGR